MFTKSRFCLLRPLSYGWGVSLTEYVLSALPRRPIYTYKHIQLADNPWICDCNILPLWNFLRQKTNIKITVSCAVLCLVVDKRLMRDFVRPSIDRFICRSVGPFTGCVGKCESTHFECCMCDCVWREERRYCNPALHVSSLLL